MEKQLSTVSTNKDPRQLLLCLSLRPTTTIYSREILIILLNLYVKGKSIPGKGVPDRQLKPERAPWQ